MICAEGKPLFHFEQPDSLTGLIKHLDTEEAASEQVFKTVIAATSKRSLTAHHGWIDQLMKATAWNEMVLFLIEIEIPRWKLRRILYEDGEWHYSLSTQRELPDWLDEAVDANHRVLALALTRGFVEALRHDRLRHEQRSSVPLVRDGPIGLVNCDNFR